MVRPPFYLSPELPYAGPPRSFRGPSLIPLRAIKRDLQGAVVAVVICRDHSGSEFCATRDRLSDALEVHPVGYPFLERNARDDRLA